MGALKPIGDQLRDWRQRRRLSQLDFALEANISARHLSFLETGRSSPSRDMLLHLAEQLEVPLRERNVMLVSAGYAPVYPERPLDDPAMSAAREAVERIINGHNPYPAIAVDRHWNLQLANATAQMLLSGADPTLLAPPVNVIRLSLHPKGLAPNILNIGDWRGHILHRLRQQLASTGDLVLADLLSEVEAYPDPDGKPYGPVPHDFDRLGIAVPLKFRTPAGVLSFFGTITVFGTPVDVTLSELALEAFYPADQATADALRQIGG